jgi:exopolyphosphatase / guanosine-5'-triphosphate,3'-diphosphate pyrophosphatase
VTGSPDPRGSGLPPTSGGQTGGQSPASLSPVYAALDLGTNNCRLLVARPSRRGFKVIDAFSRIIRLGEGVTATGRLSEAAMARTAAALQVCAAKVSRHQVTRKRLVATEACRIAANGAEFLARIRQETGLGIEILSREDEARLAVSGCATLIDPEADLVLVFDIGGGSSELIWIDLGVKQVQRSEINGVPHFSRPGWSLSDRVDVQKRIRAWTSLPVGVVTLAERFGGGFVGPDEFEKMVQFVTGLLHPFEAKAQIARELSGRNVHLLGTSGTVTTVAGVHMGLPRYDRARVDGSWMTTTAVRDVTSRLVAATHQQRIAEPCIGHERADLVLAGCAILEAMLRAWPCERLRVADRGLREGILTMLMADDLAARRGRW